MNVKELILDCDETLLSLYLFDKENSVCGFREDLYGMIKDECREFIRKLKEIEPVSDGKKIVLCSEAVENGRKIKKGYLYKKEELDSFDLDSYIIPENISDFSPAEIYEFIKNSGLPDGYAFELEPWREILGYETDEKNVNEFGKYIVGQTILHEMAFFGMEDESSKNEFKDNLMKRAEILNETMKDPEFDPEAYFVSAEEVYQRLGFVKKPHDRLEMEKAEKRLAAETLLSFLERYRTIKTYKKQNRPE